MADGMKIFPVLDILDGQVVRGIGGFRDQYCPIVTPLAATSDPLHIAEAIREQYGLAEFYLADLDGIRGGSPNDALMSNLAQPGFSWLVDRGVRSREELARVLAYPSTRAILALETLTTPDIVRQAVEQHGPSRLIFSLDLIQGSPVSPFAAWSAATPVSIAKDVIAYGVTSLIVLELRSVGSESGPSTSALCRSLREIFPEIEIITGGGVRDLADLQQLESVGVDAVLIASALHKGTLSPNQVRSFG